MTLAGNSASAVLAELIRTDVAGAIPCFAIVTPTLSKICIADPANSSTANYKHWLANGQTFASLREDNTSIAFSIGTLGHSQSFDASWRTESKETDLIHERQQYLAVDCHWSTAKIVQVGEYS